MPSPVEPVQTSLFSRNARTTRQRWGFTDDTTVPNGLSHQGSVASTSPQQELFLAETSITQEELAEQPRRMIEAVQAIEPIAYQGGTFLQPEARSGGLMFFAPTRWGKSRVEGRGIAFSDLEQGVATIIIDARGEAINNLIDKISYVKPREKQLALFNKIIYCKMSGETIYGETYVPVWPMLKQAENETLYQVSQKFIDLISKTERSFAAAPIMGLERFANILTNLSLALAAYQLPITGVFSILDDPDAWKASFANLKEYPEVKEAIAELEYQLQTDVRFREQVVEPLRNRLSFLRQDLVSRTMFTEDTAAVDWEQAITEGKTILLDYSGVKLDSRIGRVKLFWVWESLLDYLRTRSRTSPPVSLVIDELAAFVRGTGLNRDKISDDFIELINVLKGNGNIWPSFATQNIEFLPPDMAAACLSMGSKIFGAIHDLEVARDLAQHHFDIDPMKYKVIEREGEWEGIQVGTKRGRGGHGIPIMQSQFNRAPGDPGRVLSAFVSSVDQTDANARMFVNQETGHGLFAQAQHEGHTPKELVPITVTPLDYGQWIQEELVEKARQQLILRVSAKVTEPQAVAPYQPEEPKEALEPPETKKRSPQKREPEQVEQKKSPLEGRRGRRPSSLSGSE